jgi:uncharacterized protein
LSILSARAAPSFFDPELIEIVQGQPKGLFIDGGLTPHNNPSLMLLMTAMLPPYGLSWELGPENLLIVSVGTGSFRSGLDPLRGARLSAIGLAIRSLSGMITESQQLVLTLMTYLGDSPVRWPINSEIGDVGQIVAPTGHLFRYLRYDLQLEDRWLRQDLDETLSTEAIAGLQQMDRPSSMAALYELGRKAAAKQIKRSDLEAINSRTENSPAI